MPLISIVTVVRNDLTGLRKTQHSVGCQSWTDHEWIVIDGASTDGTAALALSLAGGQVRAVSEPDRGIFDAMNKGLGLATGDYVLFLNAGDIFPQADTLALVAQHLRVDAPDLLYGDSFEDRGQAGQRLYKAARDSARIDYGMFACHQTMYYRRALVDPQGYRQDFKVAGDYDFTARFLQRCAKVVHVGQPLCVFDLSGISNLNKALGRRENWRVQHEVLALPWPQKIKNRLAYLVSATLVTHFPGAYEKIRFGKRA